jgi:hypothetical protein
MADIYNGIDLDSEESGPKALREALKAQKRQNEELQEKYENLFKENRTRTVQDTLKEKGLPAKVAGLIPADVDPTEWLTEYGDVLGLKEQDSGTQGEQNMQSAGGTVDQSAALAQQFQAFQAAQSQAVSGQTPGQANPQIAALEKAGQEGGTAGIIDQMRALGIVA